jgi:hypothetical protein
MKTSRIFLFCSLIILLIINVNCSKNPSETENRPPYTPHSPSPSDSATIDSLHVILLWSGGDPDGDSVTYDVYFGTSIVVSLISNDQSATYYDLGTLPNDTYYWKIIAEDNHSNITESEIWQFTLVGALPITGLQIMSDTEGDGVVITWDQISNIDGYDVITPNGDTILLDWDENSYNDDAPTSTGTYSVCSVLGALQSPYSSISDAPYASSSNQTIYVWSSVDPSGFGWNTLTGIGTVYNCNSINSAVIDFYLNDSTAAFDFTSADEPPYSGDKTTHILNMGNSNFYVAPSVGYYNTEAVVAGNYYAFEVQGNYFAKVYVVSATGGAAATFSYWFQTIQSLRIF